VESAWSPAPDSEARSRSSATGPLSHGNVRPLPSLGDGRKCVLHNVADPHQTFHEGPKGRAGVNRRFKALNWVSTSGRPNADTLGPRDLATVIHPEVDMHRPRLGVVVAALLVAYSAPHAVAAPLLESQFLSFDTLNGPRAIAMGDLNGDGKLDVVVANYESDVVTIMRGNGDGTLTLMGAIGTGSSTAVAIGDLNGDGRPDLAVTNEGAGVGDVIVLLGNGSFGFVLDASYPTNEHPGSVSIGDLNGDGKPDLVVANAGRYPTPGTVSVWLGNGDGTFGARTDNDPGGNPTSAAIAELNGDGKPDLIVANLQGSVSVLLGNGSGGFGPHDDFPTGLAPNAMATGDLNADGKVDAVTASGSYDSLSVLLGNGDGTFGEMTGYGVRGQAMAVALGDLDGDGRPDVVTVVQTDTVWVRLGNGDGTFGVDAGFATGTGPDAVAIGELSGDGKLDVVTTNAGSSTVAVLIGNGDGKFGHGRTFETASAPKWLAIGDLNGDGKPDVATANDPGSPDSVISVLLGDGHGNFGPKTDYVMGLTPFSIAIGDVNGDGKPDLVTANYYINTTSILFGNGDGTFGGRAAFATGSGPNGVAIGDLNGDGKADLAVANSNANTVSVLLGSGGGSFAPKADYATGSGPMSVAIGDLNRDGKRDLVTSDYYSGTVSVLLGKGDGTFLGKATYSTGPGPNWVAIGDLNGDGKPDLAVANSAANTVSVLLGNGSGGFGAKTDIRVGTDPWSVAIVDLNADGKADLVAANNIDNTVSVLLGNGHGGFEAKADYGIGGRPTSVVIADLNGDGGLDLATSGYFADRVTVLLNLASSVPTATEVALVRSEITAGRVELGWYGASMAGVPATLYRRTELTAWSSLGQITGDGTGMLHFEDADVRPGVRYDYRLGVRGVGGERYYGETSITVPGLELALAGLRPNPAAGEPVASFTLASGSPARLELLDVTGRVWLTRAVGGLGPGNHVLRLGKSLPAGMYWLRLTQNDRSLLARGVVVR